MASDQIWIGNDHGGYDLALQVLDSLEKKGIPAQHVGSFFGRDRPVSALRRQGGGGGLAGRDSARHPDLFHGHRDEHHRQQVQGGAGVLVYQHLYGEDDAGPQRLQPALSGRPDHRVLEALDILEAWLATGYDGGRHDISLGLISEAENTLCVPGGWTPAGPIK